MKNDESKRNRTTLLVLLALSHGEMHGYEISKFIDTKSRGFFRMPFGSLYPVLHRLEEEKLISAKWDDDSLKPKKKYSLAAKGRKALEEQLDAFRSYTKAITLMVATET
jgi:PadR family transcriptional regulator PadR